jgi:hypothetical protein
MWSYPFLPFLFLFALFASSPKIFGNLASEVKQANNFIEKLKTEKTEN